MNTVLPGVSSHFTISALAKFLILQLSHSRSTLCLYEICSKLTILLSLLLTLNKSMPVENTVQNSAGIATERMRTF